MQRISLLLVALMALAACGSGETSATDTTVPATPTTTGATPTTTEPTPGTSTTVVNTTTTTTGGTDIGPRESDTFPGEGETAFLNSVEVTDDSAIVFAFEGDAVPAFRVEYVDPPIIADPSGMELDLAGDAFLQVAVDPGAGVDLSGDEPRETFTGEDRFTVDGVDGISELAETGDFESVLTWTIGLTAEHPFTVEAAPGTLTIELAAIEATSSLLGSDPATCSNAEGFSVSYPSDWWASTGQFACGWFAPEAMEIEPDTDITAPVMISIDDIEYRTAVSDSGPRTELDRAVSTIDGRRAVRTVSRVEEGLYPTGTEVTTYLVDVDSPDGSDLTLSATAIDLEGFDYDRAVEVLDEMVRTIQLDRPGPDDLVAIYEGGATPFEVTATTTDGRTCLAVTPGDAEACLEAPNGNRVVAALSGDALVGLAGPDVFEVQVQNGVSFLPVEVDRSVFAWAVPFDATEFTVLGSDGDTVLIEGLS